MSKRQSDWCIPTEAAELLATIFTVPMIAILASYLLPVIVWMKSGDLLDLFHTKIGVAAAAAFFS
jgi:hypothetical protein